MYDTIDNSNALIADSFQQFIVVNSNDMPWWVVLMFLQSEKDKSLPSVVELGTSMRMVVGSKPALIVRS